MVLDELVSTLYRKYDNIKNKLVSARNYLPKPRYLFSAGLAAFVLSHGDMNKASAEIKVDEYQVTYDLDEQDYADVSERYIFWRDFRNGDEDIFGFDMGPDGKFGTGDDLGEFPVTTHPSVQRIPKGCKRYVVYETYEFDSNGDIELAKIVDGSVVGRVSITKYGAAQRYPHIYVDDSDNITIVWQDNRNGLYGDANPDNDNWDIYKWESTSSWDTGIETQVTTNTCDQLSPAVWFDGANTIITFADSRNYDCLWWGSYTNVFVKIDNNPEFEIDSDFHTVDRSPIDGDLIVYSAYRNGSYNIIVYNWKDITETLFDKPGNQRGPHISKDIIVYKEGIKDIYGRFISDGSEFLVTKNQNGIDYPVVHKNEDIINIIYDKDNPLNDDIFLSRVYTLSVSSLVSLVILSGTLLGLGSKKLRNSDVNKERGRYVLSKSFLRE